MGKTIPGGYYQTVQADGSLSKPYDAWGRELDEVSGKVLEKELKDQESMSPAELEAQTRQRQAQIAAEEAERNAEKAKQAEKEAQRALQSASKHKR